MGWAIGHNSSATPNRVIKSCLALAVLFLLGDIRLIVRAQAEADSAQVVYQGVSFRVEQRLAAGGDLLKIVLDGKPFLVSESAAPQQVALRYLRDLKLSERLSTKELKTIASAAAQLGDADLLKAAIQVGLVREAPSEFDSEELWRNLSLDAEIAAVVWSAVFEVAARAPLERVCLAVATVKSQLSFNSDRYLPEQLEQSCLEQAQREAIEKTLRGDDLNQLIQSLHSRIATFEPKLIERVVAPFELEQTLQDLARASDQGDLKLFESSLSALLVKGEALGVALNASVLQHSFTSCLVAQGAYVQAIRQISSLPFEKRKASTHADLLKALSGLHTSDLSVLLDPEIRAALLRYAAKDEEIYTEWLKINYQLIGDLLRAGSGDSAEHLARLLGQESPGTAPPITLRLKLALRGGAIWRFLSLLLAVCVLVAGFISLKKRKVRSLNVRDDQRFAKEPELEKALYSEEYLILLRVFGLEPGVDLSEIKNAYRSAVKQYHPDLQGSDSTRDASSFVKLTSDYRRLLELHAQESLAPSCDTL
jgi:hypothetical protein